MMQGVHHDHECLTHITDIDAPFPGVVGCVLQLISALISDKCYL